MGFIRLPSRMHRWVFEGGLRCKPREFAAVADAAAPGFFASGAEKERRGAMRNRIAEIRAAMPAAEPAYSPTADERDYIGRIATAIGRHAGKNLGAVAGALYDITWPINIERSVPARPCDLGFYLDENLVRPDSGVMTAGKIVAAPKMDMPGPFGASGIVVTPVGDETELRVVDIALLRALGFQAYVSHGVNTRGQMEPVITVLDKERIAVVATNPEFLWGSILAEVHIVDDRGLYAHLMALRAKDRVMELGHSIMVAAIGIMKECGVHLGVIRELGFGTLDLGGVHIGISTKDIVSDMRHPHTGQTARQFLEAARILTAVQVGQIEIAYKRWKMQNGVDGSIDRIAGMLVEARKVWWDGPFFATIRERAANALPFQEWERLTGRFDTESGSIAQGDNAVTRGKWPPEIR